MIATMQMAATAKNLAGIEVEDDGAGSIRAPRTPGGGMTGMAERVSAYGGDLTCGARQPRGWRVTARLAAS
jgi:glucose-6-phosphate-specific signal transduction histidine kinase